MSDAPPFPPIADDMLGHLQTVARQNTAALHAAAELLLDRMHAGGLVLTGGSGHSLTGVLESFYRAGGLAAVRPLYHPDLLPLHGVSTSTRAERAHGLAERTLASAGLRADRDVLVIFSNSGSNPYPVELAVAAKAAGTPVIGVTSPASAAAAPRRAPSKLAGQAMLAGQADIVLDTLVPPGDASYPADAPATAPLSSLANTFLWNLLLAEVHDAACARGLELPLWRSANIAGGDEANAAHATRYGSRVPELSA